MTFCTRHFITAPSKSSGEYEVVGVTSSILAPWVAFFWDSSTLANTWPTVPSGSAIVP